MESPADPDSTIGEDLWALPGLVDAHSHLAVAQLDYGPGNFDEAVERVKEALRAGVILILDKGWRDRTTIEVMALVPEEERPEMEAAAEVIAAEEGYYPGFALEAAPGEVGKLATRQAKVGEGWVKLIGDWPRRGRGPVANFDEGELRQAVEAADSAGARVAIHTMARDVPSVAVAAGVHSIEHGLFLTEDDIAVLGARRGMWVPTVLRVQETITQLGLDSSGGRLLSEGLENVRNLLPLAGEAGVHVLAGTDLVGSPANVAHEAIKLGEYGLTNRQVVKAVAIAGFTATGRVHDFTVGAPADAVLFPEDPLFDLNVLTNPSHVVRRGRII